MTDASDRLTSIRRLWSDGDYPEVGDLFGGVGAVVVEAAGVAGREVLDVATGTGATALAAARAGAGSVVGIDATPELLAVAEDRAEQEGLVVEWREGDMEALPFDDAQFDVVTSTFGLMFAADQAGAAAGVVRVCRPGGVVVLTAWTDASIFGALTRTLSGYLPPPPPGAPSFREWADPSGLARIFSGLPVELSVQETSVPIRLPSADNALTLFETKAAPVMAAQRAIEPTGRWPEARAAVLALFEARSAPDGTCHVDPAYALTLAQVQK